MKKLAVLGSSGGNLYTQGGNDPDGMMKEIFNQADSAGIEVSFIQFVATSGSMDTIAKDAVARLYTLGEDSQLSASGEASLEEINVLAADYDKKLAALIRAATQGYWENVFICLLVLFLLLLGLMFFLMFHFCSLLLLLLYILYLHLIL